MSLEEFDLLEIPVLCCLQVAHVRHRRSNQGADTFGVPINSVIITALAAIAGSLVGALGSAVGTWITARHQDRRDLLGKQIARREALYSDFIGESARLLVDAMQHNVSDLQKLLPVYALLSRIRLSSSEPVLQTAEKVIKTIVNTYPQPNLTADQIESRAVNGQDPLRQFTARDSIWSAVRLGCGYVFTIVFMTFSAVCRTGSEELSRMRLSSA